MKRKPIAIAMLAAGGLLIPAPAAAQSAFHLRNDTRQMLSCGLRRAHGSLFDLFVLRPGGDWSQAADGGAARLLQCDVNAPPLRARLRPGILYVLAEGRGSNAVELRVAGAR